MSSNLRLALAATGLRRSWTNLHRDGRWHFERRGNGDRVFESFKSPAAYWLGSKTCFGLSYCVLDGEKTGKRVLRATKLANDASLRSVPLHG